MQLQVRSISGESAGVAEASDAVFGAPPNQDLLHQALVYYQANQRQGTSNTLTRAQVSGGGRKPFAQKGTGRARQGSTRSPLQRHGGIVFGPHPRSYRQRMPKRTRRQAIRIALSGKVAGERMVVVKDLDDAEPKTHALRGVLNALGVTGSALVVMRDQHPDVARAVRNLPRVKAVRADLLNVLDLLRYDAVVMTTEALEQANDLWSSADRKPRAVRTPKATAAAPEPEAVAEPPPAQPAAEAPEPTSRRRAPRPKASGPESEAAAEPPPAAEAPKPTPRRRAPRSRASGEEKAAPAAE